MPYGSDSKVRRLALTLTIIAALLRVGDYCLCGELQGDTSFISGVFAGGVAMALTPSGKLFVLDGERDEVVRFSQSGKEEARAGGRGWSGIVFDQPTDICALTDIEIFVVDQGNNRILRIDHSLSVSSEFLTEGRDITFRYPLSVTQSGLGKLLIVDGEFGRIVELDQNRNVSRIFGGTGTGPGFLKKPSRVRASGSKMVYVQHDGGMVTFDTYGSFFRSVERGHLGEFITFTLYDTLVFLLDSSSVRIFDERWNPVGKVMLGQEGRKGDGVPRDIQAGRDWIYLLRTGSVDRVPYRLIPGPPR